MLGGLKLALRNARRDESAIDDSDDSGDELAPDDPHPEPRTRRHSSIRQKLSSAVRRHRGSRGSRGSVGHASLLSAVNSLPEARSTASPAAANGAHPAANGLHAGAAAPTLTLSPAHVLPPTTEKREPTRTSISTLSSRLENGKTEHSRHAAGASHRELAEKLVQDERLSAARNLPKFTAACMVNYILLSKLGEGAFSNVYHARDRRTGADVAVKAVRKYELTPPQRASVLKEVQIMRNLRHASIIRLLDFGESKEYYFLILEWANGGELFERIAALTYLSEPLSRHVITQVAHAIRYLHEDKGVVHRDIKPENLLFDEIAFVPTDPEVLAAQRAARPYDDGKADEGVFTEGLGGGGIGRVKIADFGLSKVVWEQFTATPCGTAGYTAPEIVKDQRYSKSVDMWALGCVLYTLLCGFPPFYDESIQTLTHKVARGEYEFLSPWWDDVSDDAKDLVRHLLTVDPKQRYTIDEFLAHPWCHVKPGDAASTNWGANVAAAPAGADGKSPAVSIAGRSPAPSIRSVASMSAPLGAGATPTTVASAIAEPAEDSPLLAATRGPRRGTKSPGLTQLREAFDVSYALHRAEEEAAHRKSLGYAAAEPGGALVGLAEDDETEADEDEAHGVASAVVGGAGAPREARWGTASPEVAALRASTSTSASASMDRTPRLETRDADAADAGDGIEPTSVKEDAAATAAAERFARLNLASANDAHTHSPFELSLDSATLLGRRKQR